ncbi:hypothetical protein CSE_04030 [Caldisericum exile AZM16c01]|uniref:Uncharacterized protein n=1 Tax=Caldisericum exile (strain DSM 21853 / NBRC 104410 / AZM16c01) TaxID=511051 RepID=A0A7U6GDR9_CALEA|nr:hypothetical protein CSE_04030 [Caldisericum exile AZM16c01]
MKTMNTKYYRLVIFSTVKFINNISISHSYKFSSIMEEDKK